MLSYFFMERLTFALRVEPLHLEYKMIGTFWSLVPAIVAIALALISKEVYSSLFVGILIGGVFYSGLSFTGFFSHVVNDGFIAQLSNSWNVGILVFLVLLGAMVSLMNKAGGSAAFGNWAQKHIKTKVGAQLATICLGILIFIDDYFNCLTVGSVMKPVTDKYGVSKEKLSYLIDSTAAPICIIAPISSWAAAVAGFVSEGENGIALFCKAIPFNFYALFTIIMMFTLVLMRFEYGPMTKFENPFGESRSSDEKTTAEKEAVGNGGVIDLILPVAVLIVMCVLGMIYSGGFFAATIPGKVEGEMVANPAYLNFIEAFASSDASVGLVLGALAALIITFVVYMSRGVLKFKEFMSCIPDGFKSMVPAILILTLAWTLKGMTDSLGAASYVAGLVSRSAGAFKMFLPAIVFIVAIFLAFSTGTSWGTFGILIPICIAAFPDPSDPIRVISISACMAGAVCGDHTSPISDTTIMASAGAGCNHVNHVNTQIYYAMTVATISFVSYIVAGCTHSLGLLVSGIISFSVGIVSLFATLIVLKKLLKKRANSERNF